MKKRNLFLMLALLPFIINAKITDYTEDASPSSDDFILTVDTTSGANKKVQLGNLPASAAGGFTDSGATVYATTTTDNVGIGTITASTKLTVVGTVTATAFAGDGSALTGVTSGFTDGGTSIYNTTLTDNVGIGTFDTTGGKLIISGGNVGISSIAPQARLEVVGIGTTTSSTVLKILKSDFNNNLSLTDAGRMTIGDTFDGSGTSKAVNIIGKLAVGSTGNSPSATVQLNLFNNLINSSSNEGGGSFSVTQLGTGGITGVSAASAKSGTGNANDIVGISTSPSYTAGSGTQDEMYGFSTSSGSISAGGTVTDVYMIRNGSPSYSGTATNFYGGFFNDATSGTTTNNIALMANGNTASGATVAVKRVDTSITADDVIGNIDFRAEDTSTTTNPVAARIQAQSVSTVTTDVNPGRIIFLTTPTGVAGTLIEAMRITATQNVGIGTTAPSGGLVLGSGIGFQTVGIGTTVPQLPCIKANRQWGYYDGAWAGTCT